MRTRSFLLWVAARLVCLGLGATRAVSRGLLLRAHGLYLALALTLRLRRIGRLERLQRRLRGRLVAVTAEACFRQRTSLERAPDRRDPALRERRALRAGLSRLTRALVRGRAQIGEIEREQQSLRSSRETRCAVRMVEDRMYDLEADSLDSPLWASRRKLSAEAATQASLAVLRATSGEGSLHGLDLDDDPLETCAEGLGIAE